MTTVLILIALTFSGAGSSAQAQELSPMQLAQIAQRHFNIPAGPLAPALNRFADETGLQLVYDATLAEGQNTKGVSGSYTLTQALQLLLHSTRLAFQFTNNKTVTIVREAVGRNPESITLPETQVEGQAIKVEETQVTAERVHGDVAEDATTATKTDTPLLETPQSISVVTRDQMDDQAAQTVDWALRYTSGIALAERNDNRADNVTSRGFGLDEYLDGLRVAFLVPGLFFTSRIEPYLLERIEVLKGPASVLYGQASPGGLVNLISKRPTTEPFYEIQLQTGSYDRLQGAFDLSGPIDKDGHFLYRLTGLGRDTDTQIKHTKDQRLSIAPALTWRPTHDTTLMLLTSYQYDPEGGIVNFLPAEGTVLPNPNGKIPTSFYSGAPNFDKYKRTQYAAGYLFAHRFNDIWTARQNFRYGYLDVDSQQAFSLGLLPDGHTLPRFTSSGFGSLDTIMVDNQVQATFTTGPLQHTFLSGLDYQRILWDNRGGNGDAPPLDFLAPDYDQPVTTPPISFSFKQTANQLGLYAQDQIKFGKLILLLGGRHDWADSKNRDRFADTTEKQSDSAFTWRAGLLYLFDIGLAPYFSYSESFQPTSGTDASGNPFKPTTGQQYEVGVKYQPEGFNSFITLAAFELTQQNVLTLDPNDPFFSIQTGEIRSRGIELEGKASLTDGLNLTTAYAYLDNEVTKSNDVDLGKRQTGVPAHLASIWGDYTVQGGTLSGLGVGAGVRYVGSTYGDFENTFKVRDYTLVDAAVYYDLGGLRPELNGVRLAVNATNLFDKEYVTTCTSLNICFYGLRRNILGTITYRW